MFFSKQTAATALFLCCLRVRAISQKRAFASRRRVEESPHDLFLSQSQIYIHIIHTHGIHAVRLYTRIHAQPTTYEPQKNFGFPPPTLRRPTLPPPRIPCRPSTKTAAISPPVSCLFPFAHSRRDSRVIYLRF